MEQVESISVTTHEGLDRAPRSAQTRPHHVLGRNGQRLRFRNPHASATGDSGVAIGGTGVSGSDWLQQLAFILKMLRYRLSGRLPTPNVALSTLAVRRPSFLASRWGLGRGGGKATAHRKQQNQLPLRATWLGHACYYVEFPSGLRVLFDPVLEDRCSPFAWLGPRRFTPAPCGLADLPAVDAVVISHSHYDHLSGPSVRELREHHPQAHYFVGLGLADWFRQAGVKAVTEMDWWGKAEVDVDVNVHATAMAAGELSQHGRSGTRRITATVSCLPSQHTSARTAFDHDQTLWCSWAVASEGKSVYFGGDTGYRKVEEDNDYDNIQTRDKTPGCPDFAHIGRLHGPFDLGLLPIGAYSPRSLFSGVHADPLDAVDIFRDTRCRRALAMHWGTWALTSEPVMEPPMQLRMALEQRNLPMGIFEVCDVGESKEF